MLLESDKLALGDRVLRAEDEIFAKIPAEDRYSVYAMLVEYFLRQMFDDCALHYPAWEGHSIGEFFDQIVVPTMRKNLISGESRARQIDMMRPK